MADAARRAAIQRARRTHAELKRLFNTLGTADAPRGRVMIAYRLARERLRDNLDRQSLALDALRELRRSVQTGTRDLFQQAFDLGAGQAVTDLDDFEVPSLVDNFAGLGLIENAMQTVDAALFTQINNVQAQVLAGIADDSLILGDDGRVGMLSPGPVLREATRWITALALAAYWNRITAATQSARRPEIFQRQAIAALDGRTTQTCLLVHGQVVGMNEDFILRGTPRYADRLRNPGFHDYCRTVTTLLRREDAGDELTQELQEAAATELRARGDEKNGA